MKFATAYNKVFRVQPEINPAPSMTQPDQSMTIQEIMRRFANGMPLEGQRVPLYEGEDAIPIDIACMDLIDREEAIRTSTEELNALKERVKEAMAKQQEARVQRIVDKRLKAQQDAEAALRKQIEDRKRSAPEGGVDPKH